MASTRMARPTRRRLEPSTRLRPSRSSTPRQSPRSTRPLNPRSRSPPSRTPSSRRPRGPTMPRPRRSRRRSSRAGVPRPSSTRRARVGPRHRRGRDRVRGACRVRDRVRGPDRGPERGARDRIRGADRSRRGARYGRPCSTETAAAGPNRPADVARGHRGQPPEPQPAPPAGQRTIGRFIADALRAAGVRYAFTVPGESLPRAPRCVRSRGDPRRRDAATRERPSFMAEAHGQLTGRPAVSWDASRRWRQPRRSASTPRGRTRRRCSR